MHIPADRFVRAYRKARVLPAPYNLFDGEGEVATACALGILVIDKFGGPVQDSTGDPDIRGISELLDLPPQYTDDLICGFDAGFSGGDSARRSQGYRDGVACVKALDAAGLIDWHEIDCARPDW